MGTESGFRRLVNFSDAVAAIAITLLVLPLVDSATTIGPRGLSHFLHDHGSQLVAFFLSFAVIGSFWWAQHQMLEHVNGYNRVLIGAMFLWILAIVFLPFPTQLLSAARNGGQGVHGLYVGTMLVAAFAALLQQWSVVHWPALRAESYDGDADLIGSAILTALMAAAFVVVVVFPAIGLWSLLLLLFAGPLERFERARRAR